MYGGSQTRFESAGAGATICWARALMIAFQSAEITAFQYVSGPSNRKAEVLKLIAQVLEFDDEMQQRVLLLMRRFARQN